MSTMTNEMGKQVYDIEDIQNLLGIGRNTAYSLVEQTYEKQKPFRVIKIGKMYRIPKQSFDKWLSGE